MDAAKAALNVAIGPSSDPSLFLEVILTPPRAQWDRDTAAAAVHTEGGAKIPLAPGRAN